MRRAPENARYQTTTRRRYMRIILDQGLNMSQRSEALAYPSEPEGTFIVNNGIVSFASNYSCQFLFDAGATLMEAGYDAIEAEPGNSCEGAAEVRARAARGGRMMNGCMMDEVMNDGCMRHRTAPTRTAPT